MIRTRKIGPDLWVVEADGEEVAHVVAVKRYAAGNRPTWWYRFDDDDEFARKAWPSLRAIVAEVERRLHK